MAVVPSPTHIRLPMRADAVSGKGSQPGQTLPMAVPADPRTTSQEPPPVAKNKSSRRNWL